MPLHDHRNSFNRSKAVGVSLRGAVVTLVMNVGYRLRRTNICKNQAGGLAADLERPNAAGFTLLEVIVALAILALAMGPLMSAISDGLRHTGDAERVAEASSLAQSLLAEVGVTRPIQPGQTAGELANGFRWRLIVEPYGDAAERKRWPVAAYSIVAEVMWGQGVKQQRFALTTLRLGTKERQQ